ncbi:MAG: ABC-three component system middle component 8 [Candidatus Marinimicrobia bacterium]|nr:ABC-three component system middle component 8 [Candidatus Neomarinimicrobiota bacterium]
MLTPTKHTRVKYSAIYIAGIILKYIQKENIVKYEDLKEILVGDLGVKAKPRLNVSLTFLFSIGKIKYIKELDTISLIDENEIENEIS